jgi:hypothetical protein
MFFSVAKGFRPKSFKVFAHFSAENLSSLSQKMPAARGEDERKLFLGDQE